MTQVMGKVTNVSAKSNSVQLDGKEWYGARFCKDEASKKLVSEAKEGDVLTIEFEVHEKDGKTFKNVVKAGLGGGRSMNAVETEAVKKEASFEQEVEKLQFNASIVAAASDMVLDILDKRAERLKAHSINVTESFSTLVGLVTIQFFKDRRGGRD